MSNPYFRALAVGVVIGLAIQLVGGSILALLAQFAPPPDPFGSGPGLLGALDTASSFLTAAAGVPVLAALLIAWGRQGKADTRPPA